MDFLLKSLSYKKTKMYKYIYKNIILYQMKITSGICVYMHLCTYVYVFIYILTFSFGNIISQL